MKKQFKITREEFLQLVAAASSAAVLPRTYGNRVSASTDDEQTIVDFNWSDPECPEREVGELDEYFFGDLDTQDGFHLDDGDSAAESPDGCVLRTDGDEVLINSLPEEHPSQSETLEKYPERGETLVFDHYVHHPGASMEFRFGVQDDLENFYTIRFDSDTPSLSLLRVDEDVESELDIAVDFSYSEQQFHSFVIEWAREEITVSLVQDETVISISAEDDTYDSGGIGFYKEGQGIVFSYTHLWNNVEVVTDFEFDTDFEDIEEDETEAEDDDDEEESEDDEDEREEVIDYEIIEINDTGFGQVERYLVNVVTTSPCEFDDEDAAHVVSEVLDETQRSHWITIFVYDMDDDIEGAARRGFEYLPAGDREQAGDHPPAETNDDPAYEYDMHHDGC